MKARMSTSPALYDAAIVGGGPAGSTAAYVLAKAGLRAVVVDKDRFPRHHIGESLLPRTCGLYRRLDLHETLAGEGFVRKYGAQISSSDESCFIAFDFTANTDPDVAAWQVERERFDHLLLGHARKGGAEIREETLVLEAKTSVEGPQVLRVRGPGGAEEEIRARWILDASGQGSFLAKQHGLRENHPSHRKIAVYTRYRGMTRREGALAGNIDLVMGDGGWFWLIPLRDDLSSVGYVADVDRYKRSGLSPEEFLADAVRRAPYVARRLGKASLASEVWTASNYSYESRAFRGPGFTLVGDAALFLDPIWSTGVLLAMRSAELAARTLAEALGSGRLRADAFASYEEKFREWASVHFKLIDAYYDPDFPVVLFNRRDILGVSGAVTRFLAGQTELGLVDRWRMKLFYALHAAQKKWKFMKDPRSELSRVHHA
jgi:FADH2-dependent halogenase